MMAPPGAVRGACPVAGPGSRGRTALVCIHSLARKELAMRRYVLPTIVLAAVGAIVGAGSVSADSFSGRTLDGTGNNVAHPAWGQAGAQYVRVAAPNYADAIGRPVSGPPPRYI